MTREPGTGDQGPGALGIVIVTYNSREFISACLDSIGTHALDARANVVVVDNASEDGTAEAVRSFHPQVTLLESETNLGFAGGANRGIEALPGCEVICLLNPDAVLLDGGTSEAARYMAADANAGVLGGRILNLDGTVQASARAFPGHRNAFFNRHSLTTRLFPGNRVSRDYLMSGWAHDEVRPVDWVSGAFMFIHRRAIAVVGALDAGFFFSIEDVDYCRRVRDAGLEVIYFPGASIRHRVGGSSRSAVYRAMAAHHRGMWRYYRKHLRGNLALDAVTLAGICARFGLHAASYTLRTGANRLLGRANP